MKSDRYYIVPFLIYVLAAPVSLWLLPNPFLAYSLKIAGTGIILFLYRRHYPELIGPFRPSRWALWAALAIGGSWVLIDPYYPKLGPQSHFDPSALPPSWYLLVVGIRLLGSTLVASLMEELFVRSFVLRFIINPEGWRNVPMGQFTWPSFAVTLLIFGVSHDRWLAGLLTGLLLNLLLYRTKDLRDCAIAHAIANFALGIYVILARQWIFW